MLTEREQSYYGELFQTCDVDGTGKFSGGQVAELFRASGLTQEVLSQITELCGAKRLGHFGRSQFYIALKLIAAVQCGLPVATESISSGVDIPLPKFHKITPNEQGIPHQQSLNIADPSATGERVSTQGQLPPPPTSAKKSHGRNLSGQFRGLHPEQVPLQMPQPAPAQVPVKDGLTETKSPTIVQGPPLSAPPQIAQGPPPLASAPPQIPTVPQSPPTSPQTAPIGQNIPTSSAPIVNNFQVQQHASNTQTVNQSTNVASSKKTVSQKGTEEWARFESDDEKHGLLGQGKKEGWDNMKLPDFETSSYSSDTESVEDVWSINDEQREYYIKQFQNIEPDVNGHISGAVAKDFFEKSKLPNQELSKIWNLSDLNKDGALSLEEFCIAMHLVVLRRNEIEIPDRLPFSLMPYNAFTNEDAEPFAADLPEGSTLKRQSPISPPEAHQWDQMMIQGSPQISSSEVSSPSQTPANFDFQKPESSDAEANIVRPKAQRLSPDMLEDMPEVVRPEREPLTGEGIVPDGEHVPVTKQRSNTTHIADHNHVDPSAASLHGRPRPLVKRNTVPGAMPGHILPPAPISSQLVLDPAQGGEPGQEPPAPPPRPGGPHNRSMSVDYKAPPAVPPRITPKEPPGNKKLSQLKHFEPIQSQEVLNIIPGSDATTTINSIDTDKHRRSQSLDYRQVGVGQERSEAEPKTAVAWDLLGEDFVDGSAERQAEFALAAQRQASRDKKELQMAIRTHKERNSTLSRLNSELNQELQEVMEQRIALEIQLEHLRPFSS
ncbi:ralBP1-associated Eps domain-containing protein 1-like isoform X2 [Ruditapes philippinarum]|uniref:ralBP1-associated Eps domain-containing protein 1-like isoform X2 n=1 Tax=Ruditapes philippinarum TaxID=129788 RepID=UPI00295BE936|nr:ralBP1-associated Eps domain-containing protein 1-like isoform X2 [Ruditapes philippinarum]